MTPEERLAVFKKRLQDRLALARKALDEQGLEDVAALIPIEEVLVWLEDE